jgi:hypothetical protein
MADAQSEKVEEIWVSIAEAAKITGYSKDRVQRIAYRNWNLPEEEREILLRRHSNGYMIHLPSLIKYALSPRRGPQPKRKHLST